MTNFKDFFNPLNIKHIDAYIVLQETGAWPEGFVPKDVKFNLIWRLDIQQSMADCWIKYAKAKHYTKADQLTELEVIAKVQEVYMGDDPDRPKFIQAIKYYRELAECSLKEAKEFVEQITARKL